MKPGLICLGFFTKREYLFEIMYLYLIKSKQLRKYNQNWVDWHNFIAHINKLSTTFQTTLPFALKVLYLLTL